MHPLLEKLFIKQGIESVDKLKDFERADFELWESILSDPEGNVTLESVQRFCERQISIIEKEWGDLDNTKEKNERLVFLHTVYKSILGAIFNPKRAEREALEKRLQDLL